MSGKRAYPDAVIDVSADTIGVTPTDASAASACTRFIGVLLVLERAGLDDRPFRCRLGFRQRRRSAPVGLRRRQRSRRGRYSRRRGCGDRLGGRLPALRGDGGRARPGPAARLSRGGLLPGPQQLLWFSAGKCCSPRPRSPSTICRSRPASSFGSRDISVHSCRRRSTARGRDFHSNRRRAVIAKAEQLGRTARQVDDAITRVWPAIVDADDDCPAIVEIGTRA